MRVLRLFGGAWLLLISRAFAQPQTLIVTPAGADAQVFLLGVSGAGCAESEVTPLPPSGSLTDLRSHFKEGCGCEAAATDRKRASLIGVGIIARGRSGTYVDATRLCRFHNGALTVELRPRRPVRVDIWTPSAEMLALARDDIANLDWALDFNMAGATIDPVFHKPSTLVTGKDFCSQSPPAEIYTPGVINLYFGAGTLNQSCGKGSAVLIHDLPVLGDAIHEIGHRLGLNGSDRSGEDFANGHTTERKGFACDNAMWESSDVLKKFYSPAQAFWMNFNCGSFAASNGPCLRCGPPVEGDVADSPVCPNFALGLPDKPASCEACTLDQALRLLQASGRKDLRIQQTEKASLCDQDTLRLRLRERFEALSKHVAGKPHLKMGSPSLGAFVDRWSQRIRVILTVETTARTPEGSPQRNEGLAVLEDLTKQRRYSGNQYLPYSIGKIRQGKYQPRCQTPEVPEQAK